MSTSAQNVEFTDDDLIVSLVDGRKVVVPLVWFPRLASATKSQLKNFELLGDGEGIHWPESSWADELGRVDALFSNKGRSEAPNAWVIATASLRR